MRINKYFKLFESRSSNLSEEEFFKLLKENCQDFIKNPKPLQRVKRDSIMYSYINMFAGIGTLILFAVVQISMILIALFYKEKLTINKILGVIVAFGGLAFLLYPKEDFSISFFQRLKY